MVNLKCLFIRRSLFFWSSIFRQVLPGWIWIWTLLQGRLNFFLVSIRISDGMFKSIGIRSTLEFYHDPGLEIDESMQGPSFKQALCKRLKHQSGAAAAPAPLWFSLESRAGKVGLLQNGRSLTAQSLHQCWNVETTLTTLRDPDKPHFRGENVMAFPMSSSFSSPCQRSKEP